MASTKAGHLALDGVEYAIAENTYLKEVQTPFNNRFSTGDPSVGDLSFFQFLSMDDFSGGNGQDIFNITNQFFDSDGIDVTVPQELKLAPKIEFIASVNGPQHEHLNEPVEDEDGWPEVIEWLGQAVIFNDRIEFDSGGVDFLEVFDTDIVKDQVIGKDTSGQAGVITNDTRATILSISKPSGLPGDVILVKVLFSRIQLEMMAFDFKYAFPDAPQGNNSFLEYVRFRLDFGGDAERQSDSFSFQDITYARQPEQFEFQPTGNKGGASQVVPNNPTTGEPFTYLFKLNRDVEIDFTVRVPNKAPGIYNLWTSAGWRNGPFKKFDKQGNEILRTEGGPNIQDFDPLANAKVLFFIESINDVVVIRKNLYAPQLKAACVSGDKLIGGRVFDNKAYIEVYEKQNGAVDRTLQIDLTVVSGIPNPPTYMSLIASNDVIIAAFDNLIYKIDITTAALTDAQRITSIGTVPGTYVSGMEVWNQRVYIGSFDKSKFTSAISWSNLEVIQSSYAIDGKFWITDLATFNGALFYSGGTQEGVGQVRAFPAEIILEFRHPQFDNRVRTLNAGRKLYAGWSHGVGMGVITDRGASSWAKVNLTEESTNVVWDLEEVGDTVFMLAGNGFYRTTAKYISNGSLETSKIGGNTPLIDKDWSTVTVELKEKLSGAHKVKIWAANSASPDNFALLGEITVDNETATEIQFPQNFSASWVKLLVELSTTDENTTPIVKKITVKYVPQSLNKLQWAFGVRAYDNIELLNGKKDGRTGAQILSKLFELPLKGNISFRDIDDNDYSVTISDMKQTNPVIDKTRLEGLVMIELLEL